VRHENVHNFKGANLITGFDREIAAMLRTAPDKIAINDLVVHQPAQQVFFYVERGDSVGAFPAIVKVNHGELGFLNLDGIPYSRISILNEPTEA
jgi:hypothetical protein